MVVDPSGEIAPYIELHDGAAKTGVAAGFHYTTIYGKGWPGCEKQPRAVGLLSIPNAAVG